MTARSFRRGTHPPVVASYRRTIILPVLPPSKSFMRASGASVQALHDVDGEGQSSFGKPGGEILDGLTDRFK